MNGPINHAIQVQHYDKINKRLIEGLDHVETETNQGNTPQHHNETISSAMRGDVPSFGVLFFQYALPIHKFIFAQVNDPILAQDLTEEAFFQAWNYRAGFKITQGFQIYLFQHARKALARHYRENPNQGLAQTPLASLRPFLAQIFILHDILEFHFAEICQILAVPVWVIKPLHRIGINSLGKIPGVPPRGSQASAGWVRSLQPQPNPSGLPLVRCMHRLVALLRAAQIQQKMRQWNQEQDRQPKYKLAFRSKLSFRAISSVVVVFTLLFGSTGVVNAAHSSIPGETLYPAKLTLEQIRLTLTASQDSQIILRAQFSHRRLDEITSLVESGQYSLLPLPIKNLERHLGFIGTYTLDAAIDDPAMFQDINLLLLRVDDQFEYLKTIQSNIPEPTRTLVINTIAAYQKNFKVSPVFSNQPAGEIDNFWQQTQPSTEDPLSNLD